MRKDGTPSPQPISRSQAEVSTHPKSDEHYELPGGEILVFGGDEVYPRASAVGYQTRLIDPYQSARFYDHEHYRHVFAIPGQS
ncbi:MAG: hypothetical protein J2P49_01360 [Methylocapsa sp.]|nr:hypothetical protein [Methylocapsa sp.]